MSGRTKAVEWIDEVDRDRLMEVTGGIARWVRLSGSEDERKAFEYVADLMRDRGCEVTIHEPTCLVSLPVSAELIVDGESFPCITHSFSTATGDQDVRGQLIYAGSGTVEELGSAGAADRIALTEGLATPQKALAATQAGVRALICNSGEHLHEMIVSGVWGSPTLETLDLLPDVPVISVDEQSAAQIRTKIGAGPVSATIRTEVDTGWRPIPVMVADLAVDDRDYVLFSGHIDSWHYGAMDNGSANATMIEVAKVLNEHRDDLQRGVRFAFWSGHSHARYGGSTWFADQYWFDLRERCVAHVNVDSTGGTGATDLTTANTMAETMPLASDVISTQTGQELIYQRFGRAGDQSFWGVGLPAMFMSVSHQPLVEGEISDQVRLTGGTRTRSGGLGWWWHTTEDTVDKIDPELLERDCKIYVEVLARLTTSPVVPIDVRAPVEEMLTDLDAVESAWAGLSDQIDVGADAPGFGALRADLDKLRDLATQVMERIDQTHDAQGQTQLSAAVVEACKRLLPVNYTRQGQFDHDLALGTVPLPALQPEKLVVAMSEDERWAALHGLRRAINRVRHGVRSAAQVLGDCLSATR